MKKKKNRVDLRFLYMWIPMILLEIIFHIVQFKSFDVFTFLRMFFYTLFVSELICIICSLFKNRKVYFIVGLIYFILICSYSFVELIFKNFMGDFYSFGTVGDGALRIA